MITNFTFIALFISTLALALEQPHVLPLANRLSVLTKGEAKALVKLKEEAKDTGFTVPSQKATHLLALAIKPVLFSDIDLDIKKLEVALQASYDRNLRQAMDDWRTAHQNSQSGIKDFKLVSVSKSGFKIKMPLETTSQAFDHAIQQLQSYVAEKGGICSVIHMNLELKVICLNLTYRRTAETMVDEVRKVTSIVRGHETQAGGQVCTASGCGTFKSASVRQMNSSSTKLVKTGKKVRETQTKNYIDRADILTFDQIKIEELL